MNPTIPVWTLKPAQYERVLERVWTQRRKPPRHEYRREKRAEAELVELHRLPMPEGIGLRTLVDLAHDVIGTQDFESAIVVLVSHVEVLGVALLHDGEQLETRVHASRACEAARLASATGLLFAHNHPIGGEAPSEADRRTTSRLREVCEGRNLNFRGSVIVTKDRSKHHIIDLRRSA